MRRLTFAIIAAAVSLGACSAGDGGPGAADVKLGPVDGLDLPGSDLDRIKVGDVAPDFSLESLAGPVVTLSSFRGQKDVILVFYRGYW